MTSNIAQFSSLCAVLDGFVESADQALRVLFYYNMLVDFYIRSVLDPEAAEGEVAEAKNEWEICLPQELNLNTADNSSTRYPSLMMVWSEIEAWLPDLQDNAAMLKRETNYRGILRPVYETYVYEALYGSEKYHALIKDILLKQPRYEAQPEDSQEQLAARWSSTEPDRFHGLTQALLPFLEDTVALRHVLDIFGRITLSVSYYWTSERYTLEEDDRDYVAGFVDWYAAQLREPFSAFPRYVRQVLAKLNVEGCFRLLMHDAEVILAGLGECVLGWRLHEFMVGYAMQLNANSSNRIFEVICDLGWGEFLDPEAQEKYDWVDPEYQYTLRYIRDEHENDDNDELVLYTDTSYEPAGSPLHPTSFARPALPSEVGRYPQCPCCLEPLEAGAPDINMTPMRLRCPSRHVLHHSCMSELINGVEEYSNLCPTCRYEICERRERLAIPGGLGEVRRPRRIFWEGLYIGV